MTATAVAATFEQVDEPLQIGRRISVRMVHRITDTRLCGEMDHDVRLLIGKHADYVRLFCEVVVPAAERVRDGAT